MTCSFVAYIDESGDEGLLGKPGSSEWFVLSAVIARKANELETVKLVDRVRQQLNRPLTKPLHFRDLRHEHRVPFIHEIARSPLRATTLLVHKPSIAEPETFREASRLYFYCVRYLVERISWCCRDHRREGEGDGTAEIVFSNRSGMSYEELKGYMQVLRDRPEGSIDWSAIRCDQIYAFGAGRRMGLQIADAVASGFFKAVEPAYGHCEDRYARMLKPVVYRSRGIYKGYGVKFWPREIVPRLQNEERFGWYRELYG